jgi:4-hydroxybenzoyl-CoA thioesterase
VPAKCGNDVVIESSIKEFRRSSFDVEHRLTKDGALAVEGFETRVWAARDPSDPARIKSAAIPDEVIARFK